MTGKIFAETLGRGWRNMLYWGVGMAFYSLVITVAVLDDQTLEQMLSLINSMPSFLMQGFMGSADIAFMTTANGYFATKYFTTGLLIFSAYAVMAGMSVTANDEDSGILDSFLSLPIQRWSVIIERGLAHALMLLGVLLIAFLGVAIGTVFVPQMSYDLGGIIVGMFNMLPSLLFVLAVTILFGVLFRRRSVALGAASALVISSYMLAFASNGAPNSAIAILGRLSFYHYYNGVGVMQFGLDYGNVGLLVAVAALFAVLSVWRFQRRDIGL